MTKRMSQEEIADRLEIQELLGRYVTGTDDDDFDLLDSVFTPDAHLAYPDVGVDGDYPTVKAWLAEQRPNMRVWLHLVGSVRITLEGDRGRAVSTFFYTGVDHEGNAFHTGGEYHDQLTRTAEGWRISERIEHNLWNSGNAPEIPQA